jgi:hypothetical protein
MENKEKLITALNENELSFFLIGKGDYYIICKYADMPTDPLEVEKTVFEYYNNFHNIFFLKKYIESIIDISKDSTYSWLSLYYLMGLIRMKKRVGLNNEIDLEKVSTEILNNVSVNKNELKKNMNWVGANHYDGLWGDATRIVTNINNNYGLDFKLL